MTFMYHLFFFVQLVATLAVGAARQLSLDKVRSLEPGYFQKDTSGLLKTRIMPSIAKRANDSGYPKTTFTFGNSKPV